MEAPEQQLAAKQLADQLYDSVRQSIDMRRITVASVVNIVTIVMTAVEKLSVATGPQKKELALHVIARLTDEIPADREDSAAIKNAVMLLGPALIDTIIAASKGQIAINSKSCCVLC